MPIIREYESRIQASAAGKLRTEDNPYRASQSIGSGLRDIGRGVGMFGDAYTRVQEQRDTSSLQVKVADARSRVTNKLQEMSRSGQVLQEDFDDQFQTLLGEELDSLQDEMTTPLGRQAAATHAGQLKSYFTQQAGERRALAFGEKAKTDFVESLNKNANTLLSDPTQLESTLTDTLMALAAEDGPYAHIPHELRDKLAAEARQTYGASAISGLIMADPTSTRKRLLAGEWDALVTPNQKLSLVNRAETEQARVDGVARFEALVRLEDAANNGALSMPALRQAVDAKQISPEKAISLREESRRRAQEIERQRLLGIGIELGDPTALVGYSPKEVQEGFDLFAGRLMQGANTDEKRVEATNRIVTKGRELGVLPSQLKATLETASPARPAQFDNAARWYDGLRTVDPVYANAHVSPRQAALFNVYSTALAGGQGQQAAIELVRQAGDPEKMKEFRKNLSGDQLREIDGALRYRESFTTLTKSPAKNQGWARNQIEDMAKLRMAFGDAPADEAVEWATSQFKARHTLVGGRWLPIQGAASPDLAPALEEYLVRAPAALKKNGLAEGDIDPEGYELRTDPQTRVDGSMQLIEKSTGLPVPGYRIGPQEALRAYQGVKEARAKEEVAAALKERDERKAEEAGARGPSATAPDTGFVE